MAKFSALTALTALTANKVQVVLSDRSIIKHECPRRNPIVQQVAQARMTRDPIAPPTSAVRHAKSPKSVFSERRAEDGEVWAAIVPVFVPVPV